MDTKTALELYTLYRQENSLWLGNHREHSQQYFTLVIAILGASIAALSQFDKWPPVLIFLVAIGPTFNIRLCQIAITLCDRSYQAYLEGISIQSKLEQVIGLTEHRDPPTDKQLAQFSQDEYFLPERWLKERHFATTEKFVKDLRSKGANQLIKQTFKLLSLLSFLIAFGILVYALFLQINVFLASASAA